MASDVGAIELRLLGRVEAVRSGSALPLGGPRQRALLALLLIEPGKPVSVDRLAEELWHGEPPPAAATTVRAYVSRLRKSLGADAPITAGASGYALNVPNETVDARRFERLIREGEEALTRRAPRRAADRLRSALELWRGRPFEALGDEGALRREADRLEELRLSALEARIEADLELGESTDLVAELEGLVDRHPYRERFWRQLMLALYRSDRQADALAAYRRARELLDRELGIEPGDELKGLEQAILRQDVPAVAPQEERHNLPAALTSFVGRETELAEIQRLIGQARLVTLTGVGGAGKTRLALEHATRALDEFPDGVYLVDFSALADPMLVSRQVAAALGVREQAEAEIDELLSARLRAADLLLVLDNCEHLRDACAELARDLLESSRQLRVLATSREPLGAPGEVDYPVPPLGVPAADAPSEELRASESVRLLLARAREARPRLSDDEGFLVSAGRICRDLDGLPLAIELAAARAKALSLDDIASRLTDRFRFLVSWRRLAPARHRTLREAVDWSYDLLAEDERALLARLSVFVGGFTLDAVANVCLDGDDQRALELVGRLVDASLVVPDEVDRETRYRLLETIRQYAAERLEEIGGADGLRRACGRYFVDVVERVYEALKHGDPSESARPYAWFDAEQDNLRAALDYAVTGEPEDELRLAAGLWRFWWVRGQLSEGRERLARALGRGTEVAPAVRARALQGCAGLAWAQGDYDDARALASEAVAAAHLARAPWEELGAHMVLGVTGLHVEDFETARHHLEQAASLADALGSRHDATAVKLNLAELAVASGEVETAMQAFEELAAYHRRNENPEGIGFAQLDLGVALYRLGSYVDARRAFQEARGAFATIGFRAHVAHACQGLAAVETKIGSAEEAALLLGRANAVLADAQVSERDFDPGLVADAEAAARSSLGDELFSALRDQGRDSALAP